MSYSPQERTKLVEFYLVTNSLTSTQQRFRLHFTSMCFMHQQKHNKWPRENFRRKGSVLNHNRGASGRPVSVRTEETTKAVRASVIETPNKSNIKRAQALLMEQSSMLILKKDLKLTRYKMHNVQQLPLADKSAWMEICLRFREEMDNDDTWINNVWFSGEAHLHLNGNVNSQSFRTWSSEPLDEVNERPLDSGKCRAWGAVSAHGIIGPLWFEEYDTTVTITQELYWKILDSFMHCCKVSKICILNCSDFSRTVQHLTQRMRPWRRLKRCSMEGSYSSKATSYGPFILQTLVP